MDDKRKADLMHLINDLHDLARDYGHARGNNAAYRMARNKAGMYFAETFTAAAKADAAYAALVEFIAEL